MDRNQVVNQKGVTRQRYHYPSYYNQPPSGWQEFADESATQTVSIVAGNAPRPRPSVLLPSPYHRVEIRQRNPVIGRPLLNMRGSLASGDYYEQVGQLTHVDWRAPDDNQGHGVHRVPYDYISQAEVKALNSLGKGAKESAWMSGVAWGERKETSRLLENTAQRLLRFVRFLKRGDWRRAQDLLPVGSRKTWRRLRNTPYGRWLQQRQRRLRNNLLATPDVLASGILEYQNGWKPLLADVDAAAEALANRNMPEFWLLTGKGRHYVEYTDARTTDHSTAWVRVPPETREFVKFRGANVVLNAVPSDGHFRALNQVGLINPFSTAWELTPFSYIFDKFVAMGDWLESLTATAGLTFHSGCWTRKYEYTELRHADHSELGSYRGSYRHSEMKREVYVMFPFPIPPLSRKPKPLTNSSLVNIAAVAYKLLTDGRFDTRG